MAIKEAGPLPPQIARLKELDRDADEINWIIVFLRFLSTYVVDMTEE